MKAEFKLTEEEINRFKNINRTYMVVGGFEPQSPQEQANQIWKDLAQKHGFAWDSVEPSPGKGQEYFVAEKL